jgi:hypothetical protein
MIRDYSGMNLCDKHIDKSMELLSLEIFMRLAIFENCSRIGILLI